MSRLLVLLMAFWVTGASAFEFRGYHHDSTCEDVIAAEGSSGATNQHGRIADAAHHGELPVTRLDVVVFNVPGYVDIACKQESAVHSIQYVFPTNDLNEMERVYEHFASELAKIFGPKKDLSGMEGRARTYYCDETGWLQLSSSDSPVMPLGAVSIGVMLAPNVCI